MRTHMYALQVSKRQHASAYAHNEVVGYLCVPLTNVHTSADVKRQHTSAYVCIRQLPSAVGYLCVPLISVHEKLFIGPLRMTFADVCITGISYSCLPAEGQLTRGGEADAVSGKRSM